MPRRAGLWGMRASYEQHVRPCGPYPGRVPRGSLRRALEHLSTARPFLMPSRFEPCGHQPFEQPVYGTLPLRACHRRPTIRWKHAAMAAEPVQVAITPRGSGRAVAWPLRPTAALRGADAQTMRKITLDFLAREYVKLRANS